MYDLLLGRGVRAAVAPPRCPGCRRMYDSPCACCRPSRCFSANAGMCGCRGDPAEVVVVHSARCGAAGGRFPVTAHLHRTFGAIRGTRRLFSPPNCPARVRARSARSARGTAAAPTPAQKKRPAASPSATGRRAFWRRRRDSNSRDGRAAQRFSRPPHSTALPLLRVPNREAVTRRSPAILAYVRLSKTRERRACRPRPRPKSEGPRAPVQEAR